MKVVLAHGFLGLFDFFPLLFIAAAFWVILKVLREGERKRTNTTPMPRTPWSRQVHAATRKRAGTDRTVGPSSGGPGRRSGAPHLQVLEGEAADENRSAVPRRFEPPPPGRRKTG
jgi:hypothetical protein